jgi:hypothetical protein
MTVSPLIPIAGPYSPPKCRRDDKLFCHLRDAWVTVGGYRILGCHGRT